MATKQPGVGKGNYDRSSIVAKRELERRRMLGLEKPESVVFQEITDKMSEEDVAKQIRERFRVMGKLTDSVIAGHSRAEIISGPPGLGKSYNIEQKMKTHIAAGHKCAHIKGFVRTTGLYRTLFNNRNEGDLVVFDDADSVFDNIDSLNILKAACDTTEERTISYLAETTMVDDNGDKIETSFKFDGSVIFITNVDFDEKIANLDSKAEHFKALMSRSHYLNLMMKSNREYMIRVKMVAKEEGLFDKSGITDEQADVVLAYMEANLNGLREVSLRMAIKIANLIRSEKEDWKYMADITCLKPTAAINAVSLTKAA